MKNMNKIISITIAAFLAVFVFASCEEEEKHRIPELTNGGYVRFVSEPFQWEGRETFDSSVPAALRFTITYYHIGADPATASFVAMTEDANDVENVASYELMVTGEFEGAPEDPIFYKSTTSFPFDVSFTTPEMATLFGVSEDTFETGDSFVFFANIVTKDGRTWSPFASGCDCPLTEEDEDGNPLDPGTWNSGNIDGTLLQGGDTAGNNLLPAVLWRVKYKAASD
jgi:hypothetical protein